MGEHISECLKATCPFFFLLAEGRLVDLSIKLLVFSAYLNPGSCTAMTETQNESLPETQGESLHWATASECSRLLY